MIGRSEHIKRQLIDVMNFTKSQKEMIEQDEQLFIPEARQNKQQIITISGGIDQPDIVIKTSSLPSSKPNKD